MGVTELSKDQLIELKQNYLCESNEGNVSYGELANADSLVEDSVIFDVYGGFIFSEDDFLCSMEE